MATKKLLSTVLIPLVVLGCVPFSPVARYLVTEKPKEEDIIGIYKMSIQKVVDEDIQNASGSSIQLLADGNCYLTDFPVFVEDDPYGFTYQFKELFTGECEWNITTYGSVRQNGETFSVWGVCFNAISFVSMIKCADLANDGDPYNLVFVFGDPDSNEIMVFEKPSSE